MNVGTAFALRPLERNPLSASGNALEGAFRVYLTQREQKSLGLANGDLARLKTSAGFKGYAIAWLASSPNPGNKPIAKVTDLLREQYGLSLNDPTFVEKATDAWKAMKSIEVSCSDHKFASDDDLIYWVRYALVELDIILPGCTFQVQPRGPISLQRGSKSRLTVDSIDPNPSERNAVYFDPVKTQVIISGEASRGRRPLSPSGTFQLRRDSIGGLSGQIAHIDRVLAFRMGSARYVADQHLLGSTAVLFHGPEGTGKSMLLERLAECPWKEVYRLNPGTHPKGQLKAIIDTFDDARDNQPSLILMDNIDKFLEKADTLVERLRIELAKLEGSEVVVAAAARSVYDVDTSLRTRSTFKIVLEVFPPDVRQREDILRQVLGPGRKLDSIDLPGLAARTHGFVGRDIDNLCGLARSRRVDRADESLDDESKATLTEILEKTDYVTQEDFDAVIDLVQPTVLKESILEVPKVRWTDIAGVDHVRALLEAITIRPFKYPDLDIKFGGPQSRKGVLLYGPPGCAKTLIAQAVATESNQNFLAVKGSELIKMYVGESERAIRDIFRRARAAKPCIIFFDEIDSIGKSRDKTQDSGLNVVATLLNEMDGIEALKDVFIIGATNRPDILDSALIRTGRFDAHIHIGLPTEKARLQILKIHTRKRPLASDVDLSVVAAETEGSSGADISGLCKNAVEFAVNDYEKAGPESTPIIRMSHFEQALREHVPHTLGEEAERFQNWRPGMSLGS
ncbi:AAA-domain-containing protein [Ophiobolus disseminans]|uniref:AAA-domain-containing protein n=1 Tax=Ophiobolus disseminans TaxID=1469910 RepID=A0A6A7A633_9PLEO|nr:AAA-domain-containing protein [Ophiobolus disseminans]